MTYHIYRKFYRGKWSERDPGPRWRPTYTIEDAHTKEDAKHIIAEYLNLPLTIFVIITDESYSQKKKFAGNSFKRVQLNMM